MAPPRRTARLELPRPVGGDLRFTGERFTGEATGEIAHLHWHRYLFALQFCDGRDVLDVASGEGYGTALLASNARRAVGIDVSPEAVTHARRSYAAPRLNYLLGRCQALPLPDASFDIVVSFETLEHVEEHDVFLREIRRVLRPGGILVLSTPDADVYSAPGAAPNQFHLRELDRGSFRDLLERHFAHVALFDQDMAVGSAILPDGPAHGLAAPEGFRRFAGTSGGTLDVLERAEGFPRAEYLIAVASGSRLPPVRAGVLDDRPFQLELFAELQRRAEAVQRAGADAAAARRFAEGASRDLLDLQRALDEIRVTLAGAKAQLAASVAEGRRLAGERDRLASEEARLSGRVEELESEDSRLRTGLAALRAEGERLRVEIGQRDEEYSRLRDRSVVLPGLFIESTPALWARSGVARARGKLRGTLPGKALEVAWWGATGKLDRRLAERRLRRRVEESRIFDPGWYLERYPDVKAAGLDPLQHYLEHGGAEGRDPGPLFDGGHYLSLYPDVAEASANPLLHFLDHGATEGRDPNSLFDTSWYLEWHPDVAAAGLNPLTHFIAHGAAEGRRPSPGFDPAHYLRAYPDVALSGVNPLAHYLHHGAAEGRRPTADAPSAEAAAPRTGATAPLSASADPAALEAAVLDLAATRARDGAPVPAPTKLDAGPLVSLLLPAYESEPKYLELAVGSILAQTYPRWELRVVDDGSRKPATLAYLDRLRSRDPRIHVRRLEHNAGISRATNAALEDAQGAWVAMVDHDDELHPDALLEVIRAVQSNPLLDAVYTDQDYIEADGRIAEPLLKPDWSPALLGGVMYVGHLLVVRRELAREVGGCDPSFARAQDFEFMLRVGERARRVGHVPRILYHWRRIPGSVAFHGDEKGGIEPVQAAAVTAQLRRLGIAGEARPHPRHAHRAVVAPAAGLAVPRTTVLLRGGGRGEELAEAVRSLRDGPWREALDLVVVADGTAAGAGRRLEALRVPVLSEAAALERAARAGTELLLFLDADLAPATSDWLRPLSLYATQRDVAAAAPVLVDPEGRVAEAGLVLGLGGPMGRPMRGLDPDGDGYAGSLSCAREVAAVSGRCALVRAGALAAVGGLRDLFATAEYRVADLTLRAHLAGLRNIVVPTARLAQRGVASPDGASALLDRALFGDAHAAAIARGDPFHNPAFAPREPGYALD